MSVEMIFQLTKTKKGAFDTTVNIMWILTAQSICPCITGSCLAARMSVHSRSVSRIRDCAEV